MTAAPGRMSSLVVGAYGVAWDPSAPHPINYPARYVREPCTVCGGSEDDPRHRVWPCDYCQRHLLTTGEVSCERTGSHDPAVPPLRS
ncbi:MAG: hypothetical protein ACXVX9_15240 [Mycobacteriaceae bacterium]